MKNIGCSWVSFDQLGTKHLLVSVVAFTLHITSGCCDEESGKQFAFYTSDKIGTSQICSGPYLVKNGSLSLCGFNSKNCNGMNTSCFKNTCKHITRLSFKPEFSQNLSGNAIKLKSKESEIMLAAGFELCCKNNQEQTNLIESLFSNGTVLEEIDKRCKTLKSTQFSKNESGNPNWISMLTIMVTINVLVFIVVFAFFYNKFKIIKFLKPIGCNEENRENTVHDYEEINTFPHRPTPENFYHSNTIPISFDDGSFENYSILQQDQTLESNNETQQQILTPLSRN